MTFHGPAYRAACATRQLLVLLCLIPTVGLSEPYLAVREGMHCSACHVNATGGGGRNAFGNVYALTQLPSRTATGTSAKWNGSLNEFLAVGGDGRWTASQVDQDGADTNAEFATNRVSLYGAVSINNSLTLYVDQQVAPGGSLNREAWIRYEGKHYYLKAGRFFLPFGWRLEDNSAYVRQATGINMLQGDDGIEVGWNAGRFQAQVALTNGAGGGAERDDGKQFTARGSYVTGGWQAGISLLGNDTDVVDRAGFGVFAGANTGPVSWLVEYDKLTDDVSGSGDVDQDIALVEANWLIAQGHNLKATLEFIEFDGMAEDQARASLVYESAPIAFLQLRVGVRDRSSDDPNPFFDSSEAFVEVHGFF